jgi:hypothetical protein
MALRYEDKLLLIQLREERCYDSSTLRERAAERLEKAFDEIAKLQAIVDKQLY